MCKFCCCDHWISPHRIKIVSKMADQIFSCIRKKRVTVQNGLPNIFGRLKMEMLRIKLLTKYCRAPENWKIPGIKWLEHYFRAGDTLYKMAVWNDFKNRKMEVKCDWMMMTPSSFTPVACTPSRRSTTSSCSTFGTGSSTTSPSGTGSCSFGPIPSSAFRRSKRCGSRRALRSASTKVTSETTATEPAVRSEAVQIFPVFIGVAVA